MTTKEPSPAFQFYPRDFISSEGVRLMTAVGRGAYILLLCACWLEGSLPADDAQLRKLADVTETEWEGCREVVRARFVERAGRIYNARLDKERAKQRAFSKLQSDKGVKSAESRRNRGSTVVQPEVNSSSASSSSSASASSTAVQVPKNVRTSSLALRVEDGFEDFWQAYPRRKKRADAEKAWKQTAKDRPPLPAILASIDAQRRTPDWIKEGGQFIPYPASWLRAHSWADDAQTGLPMLTERTTQTIGAGGLFIHGGDFNDGH
jgi:uncharacterized protein YdaU (DUF1376 family)